MEKKNKTAKVTNTKERRITNKKVESLHKYWEAFPGLKKRLIMPVEGENYSLIKPKDVEKAVYANASVKRVCEYASSFTYDAGTSLVYLLNYKKEDNFLELMKNVTKHEARKASMEIPFVKWRHVLSDIERYWPLAEEYNKTCKAGGIMACKKHPLFINFMKMSVADDLREECEDNIHLSQYCCMAFFDYMNERTRYVSLAEKELEVIGSLIDFFQEIGKDYKQMEETVMAEVCKRMEKMDGLEYRKLLSRAFFSEISDSIENQFKDAIDDLIDKLSA